MPGAISFDDDHGHGTHVAGTIAAKAATPAASSVSHPGPA